MSIINLTQHGDPIYASMPFSELDINSSEVGLQMLNGKGEGHFYYAHVV